MTEGVWGMAEGCRCGWRAPVASDVTTMVALMEGHERMHAAAEAWHEIHRENGFEISSYVNAGMLGFDQAVVYEATPREVRPLD